MNVKKLEDLELGNLENYLEYNPFYLDQKLIKKTNNDIFGVYKKQQLLAVFPLIKKTKTNELFFPYSSYVLCKLNKNSNLSSRSELHYKVSDTIFNYLMSIKSEVIFTEDPFYSIDLRPFFWSSYSPHYYDKLKQDNQYTGILELNKLSKESNHRLNYSSSRRRDVKYGLLKSSVEFLDFDKKSSLILYSAYKSNFERQSNTFDYDKNVFDPFIDNENFKQITIKEKDNLTYCGLFSEHNGILTYHFGAGFDSGYKIFASSVLIDQLILYALENSSKINYFNVEGVNSPKRGAFKMSFGLTLKKYVSISNFKL